MRRGGLDESSVPCPACGDLARRRPFNLPALAGATVVKDQRYRVSEFQEASAEIDYAYTQAENGGMLVKRPDLFGAALRKAQRMGVPVRR